MDSRPGLGSTDPPTPVSMEPIEEPTRLKGESNGGEGKDDRVEAKGPRKGEGHWTEGQQMDRGETKEHLGSTTIRDGRGPSVVALLDARVDTTPN